MKLAQESASSREDAPHGGPQHPSRFLLKIFNWYIWWYLWLHFRSLRVAHADRLTATELPTILYLNHAAWWDPLVCIRVAQRLMPEYEHYAPMDAASLQRYGFFRKLGLFPVEHGSLRGAASFLKAAQNILQRDRSMLWITPQGRFTDVRERPVRFMQGLGALVQRTKQCRLIPVGIEYAFWDERLPEILINIGEPLVCSNALQHSAQYCTANLEQHMTATLDELSELVRTREPKNFLTLSLRHVGVGGIYQLWLHLRARAQGRTFTPEHTGIDHP